MQLLLRSERKRKKQILLLDTVYSKQRILQLSDSFPQSKSRNWNGLNREVNGLDIRSLNQRCCANDSLTTSTYCHSSVVDVDVITSVRCRQNLDADHIR